MPLAKMTYVTGVKPLILITLSQLNAAAGD